MEIDISKLLPIHHFTCLKKIDQVIDIMKNYPQKSYKSYIEEVKSKIRVSDRTYNEANWYWKKWSRWSELLAARYEESSLPLEFDLPSVYDDPVQGFCLRSKGDRRG